MLKLLLDEHISPQAAVGLRRKNKSLTVRALIELEDGVLLGQDDATCLRAAAALGLTLVTYDVRTIPSLLKAWAEEGRSHAGVIFVDAKTISPSDIGGLVRGLTELVQVTGRWNWKDRVSFLKR
jgi:hypothetical protein